jgi:hypothetical protein
MRVGSSVVECLHAKQVAPVRFPVDAILFCTESLQYSKKIFLCTTIRYKNRFRLTYCLIPLQTQPHAKILQLNSKIHYNQNFTVSWVKK